MENEIQVFENEEFGEIRTIMIDNEPWFVAADVCRALDIVNPTRALTRLEEDEKMTLHSMKCHSDERGGAQLLNVVNEAGLYSLILGSRKPEARQFKRWVTHEVIPSIRRHGVYMTDNLLEQVMQRPDVVLQMAQVLVRQLLKRGELA